MKSICIAFLKNVILWKMRQIHKNDKVKSCLKIIGGINSVRYIPHEIFTDKLTVAFICLSTSLSKQILCAYFSYGKMIV